MNRPIHFEIHASDPERLVAFYTGVFGWNIQHIPEMNYWFILTGEGPGIDGGLLQRRGPAPADNGTVNGYVCSIHVESVDASLEKALAAGATVALPKMAIPGVGWQAYIKDPDGNLVGLHQVDRSAK